MKKDQMKIAYLITRMDEYGGAQIHIRDLCTWLQTKGHEPVVLSGASGRVSDYLEHMGVSYTEIPDLVRPIRLFQDIKAFMQIRRALQKLKPDVLSCHSSKAGLLGRLAARSLGIKVVFTAHGWAFTEGVPAKKRIIYKWIEKIGSWFSDHIITVSEYDRDLALTYNVVKPKKITVIHNGMPDRPLQDKSERASEAPVRLMMVARFGPQKDHALLVRALREIKELNWNLYLIGGGDDLEIRHQVQSTGLEGRVNFLGEREDVPDMLEQADIYLLISHWEGFPRSILEAMRAGLPVIASDVAGVKESVIDKENGYLVRKGDKESLVFALRTLILDQEQQCRMGQVSRERFVSEFTFPVMAEKTVSIYQQLVGKTIVDKPESF